MRTEGLNGDWSPCGPVARRNAGSLERSALAAFSNPLTPWLLDGTRPNSSPEYTTTALDAQRLQARMRPFTK